MTHKDLIPGNIYKGLINNGFWLFKYTPPRKPKFDTCPLSHRGLSLHNINGKYGAKVVKELWNFGDSCWTFQEASLEEMQLLEPQFANYEIY